VSKEGDKDKRISEDFGRKRGLKKRGPSMQKEKKKKENP